MRPRAPAGPLLLLALLLAALSCDRSAAPGRRETLAVVATTGMIADAARRVAGDRARVTALMGEGVDPHLYKASPGDVRLLSGADLVLYNGLHLEGKLGEVLERLGARSPTVAVADAIDPSDLRSPPEFEGAFDPHVWFDAALWSRCVERIRDALVELEPEHRESYEAGAGAYLAELAELHAWTTAQIARIPPERRVLITAHDAFGYFGRAYDIEVLGIQGISTDSEASLREINSLVDLLVERRVPAVFVESSVPPKTVEALVEGCRARGHAVRIGGELFSDAMGPDGTPEGTYVGMVRHNVNTIVAALAGEVAAGGGAPAGAGAR